MKTYRGMKFHHFHPYFLLDLFFFLAHSKRLLNPRVVTAAAWEESVGEEHFAYHKNHFFQIFLFGFFRVYMHIHNIVLWFYIVYIQIFFVIFTKGALLSRIKQSLVLMVALLVFGIRQYCPWELTEILQFGRVQNMRRRL